MKETEVTATNLRKPANGGYPFELVVNPLADRAAPYGAAEVTPIDSTTREFRAFMIRVGDFRNGTVFRDGNDICTVVWFQHHKPGKGGATVRLKIKNLSRGTTVEKTIKPDVMFREVDVSRRNKQYLYKDNSGYCFMDSETFEQEHLSEEAVSDVLKFLKDDMEVIGVFIDGKFSAVEIPVNVAFEITHTEPGVKGNTAQGVKKPATIETGAEIQVPLFVNVGDKVIVNTNTGQYVERA